MRKHSLTALLLMALALGIWTTRAMGVIAVEMPLSRIYGTARGAWLGEIDKVTGNEVTLHIVTLLARAHSATSPGTPDGAGAQTQPAPGVMTVVVQTPPDLAGQLRPQMSVVVFPAKNAEGGVGGRAMLHVANRWLLLMRRDGGKPGGWEGPWDAHAMPDMKYARAFPAPPRP